MQPPTMKFAGETGDGHPGRLHWPGVHGLPCLGPSAMNLRQEEIEQLPIVGYAYHRTFDLSDATDSAWYCWVRDRIRNGMFSQDYVERWRNSDDTNMMVYLEWTQLYRYLPQNGHAGSNGHGSADARRFALRSS